MPLVQSLLQRDSAGYCSVLTLLTRIFYAAASPRLLQAPNAL